MTRAGFVLAGRMSRTAKAYPSMFRDDVVAVARKGQSWGTLTAAGTTATDAPTVDATAIPDGRFVHVQAGAAGIMDEFAVIDTGNVAGIGSVTVPGRAGGAGISAF